MDLVQRVKDITPWPVRYFSRRVKRAVQRQRNKNRPVQDIFEEIYATNKWGGEAGTFYSGPGSSADAAAKYIERVIELMRAEDVTSVVDLGCGDFRIGMKISEAAERYVGIDIVGPLIEANARSFGSDKVQFERLDIITDPLPDGDLCLVREVFQHLSNEQIANILPKLNEYRLVVVTDHQPGPSIDPIPNKNKPPGSDIRVHDKSAVYLDKPPFNVKNLELILDVRSVNCLYNPDERLRSFLIRRA